MELIGLYGMVEIEHGLTIRKASTLLTVLLLWLLPVLFFKRLSSELFESKIAKILDFVFLA